MALLFEELASLQRRFPFFNRATLSSLDLLRWIEDLEVYPVADRKASFASISKLDGHSVIYYNPNLQETLLILALGHELAHQLLGHLESIYPLRFSSPFQSHPAHDRDEREASIFASLCLIPTPNLIKLKLQERFSPEDLYADLTPLFGEYERDFGWRICLERVRIFNELLEICRARCMKGEPCRGCGGMQVVREARDPSESADEG